MMTVPEPWAAPPEVKEKIRLLYQKAELMEKSTQHFTGSGLEEVAPSQDPPFSTSQGLSDSAFSFSSSVPRQQT